jgi:hypothetical protein
MNIQKTAPWFGLLLLITSFASAQEAPTTIQEVWEIVQRQQAEIDALCGEFNEARDGLAATELTNSAVASVPASPKRSARTSRA